jgi:XTP/dITP diphosphohydrolase
MKTITLITSNLGKVREFKQILEPEVIVEHTHLEYEEMRSDDPEEIAKQSAKMLAEKLQKSVVVEDSGLFITLLDDFPGTCSAYIHKRIGLAGILKLLEGKEDRQCFYKSAVAYCEPGKDAVSFLGKEQGKIAQQELGENGFGHDSIFIPEVDNPDKETYAEMENCEEQKKFRRRAVEQLMEYLKQ